MKYYTSINYIELNNIHFFTAVFLPNREGSFPTVIFRSPYVSHEINIPESEIIQNHLNSYKNWLDRGYAIIYQHCRGQGKSSGEFVPYIFEREDGLALREWVREQSFYNGEIFLCGGSYTASLNFSTAPFESDVKGAVLEIQDSERYRLWYRNGQMRKGHANWHFSLYKSKSNLCKNFSMSSFSELPLKGLSKRVLNDTAEDFEQMLEAPFSTDPFWNTRFGGAEARNATDNATIPILLSTGYNDFYVGGVFKMWNRMSEETKKNCALLVSPYNHGDSYSEANGIAFPKGKRAEQFGNDYAIDWFDNIRTGKALPFKKGEITYYRAFENCWQDSFYKTATNPLKIPLGDGTASFEYNPLSPPAFSEEGTFQNNFEDRADVITIFTPPLDKDVFIKGQIEATLKVKSNCPDTSFYMNISIRKPQGDYALRHDITSLCYQLGDYMPNSEVALNFCFDEYAFLLKKGEVLRIDISSTDDNTYVCHTNQKGAYHLQTKTDIAVNQIDFSKSFIALPVEEN